MGTKQPALRVDYRKVADLIPYAGNARTHSPEQVAKIAASIAEFGFTNPLLVAKDGVLIAGHGRLEAARKLGLDEVPTVTLDYLSPAQRRAYVIADNKLALDAGWDNDALLAEIDRLIESGFDLDLTGFSTDELDFLRGLPDSGEVTPPPKEGGDHYTEQYGVILICQDEAEQERVFNEMQDAGFTCRVVST